MSSALRTCGEFTSLRGLSTGDRDTIWNEVVGQVTEWGSGLGHYASPPPLLEEEEAMSAAIGRPGLLRHAGDPGPQGNTR
jgi:hypothetical protein